MIDLLKKSNLILKYPYKELLFKKIAYNKYFSYSFYVFKFGKLLNKQNFVKGKITKYECISFAIIFIIIKLIYVKITLICESERSFYEASFIFSL